MRVLAQLLNDVEVREALRKCDVDVPQGTRFIAGQHDTTTDEIQIFDDSEVDPKLQHWLQGAGDKVRQERAAKLGLANLSAPELKVATRQRAKDWSQVRPEWGLANNAAFIVAPRARTRHINLDGRSFLHDYAWRNDAGFKVLELIMTAPMLVTNWINMQYNASVTDNLKYGSGNKVLHNVVGGHIGVFEGNGGDLRIGLSMQSLHDGRQWMHQPQRLSVYIQAPREAIADIIARHAVVRSLIENDWLFVYRLDDEGVSLERFYRGVWTTVHANGAVSASTPDHTRH